MNLPPTSECVRCAQARPVMWCAEVVEVGYVDIEPDVVRLVDLATGMVLIIDSSTNAGIVSFSQVLVPGHSYSLDLLQKGATVHFKLYIDAGDGALEPGGEFVKCVTFTAYKPLKTDGPVERITLST